jgi:hypothetical protein
MLAAAFLFHLAAEPCDLASFSYVTSKANAT